MNSYRFNLIKLNIIVKYFFLENVIPLKNERCWLHNKIFCIMINIFHTCTSTKKFAENSLHENLKKIMDSREPHFYQ